VARSGYYQAVKFAATVLCAAALFGQENGTISGIAVNAATGVPLAGAKLELVSYGTAYSIPGTNSGPDGSFEIRQVPPGKYRLTGTHTDFARTTYGSHSANGEGKLLTVEPKAEVSGVRMEILPLASVSGRVVDEEGRPAKGVQVALASVRPLLGTRQYGQGGTATTGEQGEYRIERVQAGRYLLMARRRGDPAVFYPRGADVRTAQEFEVAAGQPIEAMNLKLTPAKSVPVQVKIPGLAAQAAVSLIPRNGSGDLVFPAASATALRNGVEVTFEAVVPGEYLLTASGRQNSAMHYGRRELTVGDRAPEGIVLALEEGATVNGTVRMEQGEFRATAGARITLLPLDGAPMGPAPVGPLSADGTFALTDVAPRRYAVYVSGVGQGVYLKSVNEQGRELLAEGLEVAGAGTHTLSLVLSAHAGGLLGRVESEGESIVLVYPTDGALKRLPYYHWRLRTDASGRFAIQNLTPGEYEVVAVDEIEPGANLDESVMRGVAGRGKVVTVKEDSSESVTLQRVAVGGR
jgi:hypothetical protein